MGRLLCLYARGPLLLCPWRFSSVPYGPLQSVRLFVGDNGIKGYLCTVKPKCAPGQAGIGAVNAMNLYNVLSLLLPMYVATEAVRWIYFKLLRVAKAKGLVDHPEARKLQKEPVPVVGGLTVFFGLMAGMLAGCAVAGAQSVWSSAFPPGETFVHLLPLVLGMSVMLYTGCMDDVSGLSPRVRLIVEVLVMLGLTLSTSTSIDTLHGLWGIGRLPAGLALPLTLFAGVGIINAVNMMDGVNGLSSGVCIACSMLCGIHFMDIGDWGNALLALCMMASLLPFFIHNVFGRSSRMFIGDAGTMVLGLLMAWFVISIMHDARFAYGSSYTRCPTAMVLALYAVPVADTLRVMTMRVANGRSPFSADKTHLHHAFVGMGFSHGFTTLMEILMGLAVVVAWELAVRSGASMECQLYVVVAVAALLVWGTYFFLVHEQGAGSRLAGRLRSIALWTQTESRWGRYLSAYLDAPEHALSEPEHALTSRHARGGKPGQGHPSTSTSSSASPSSSASSPSDR